MYDNDVTSMELVTDETTHLEGMPESKPETKTDTGTAGTIALKESYLLCTHCDGRWVDANPHTCACGQPSTSRDFILCLACALHRRRCQHCGKRVDVRIDNC